MIKDINSQELQRISRAINECYLKRVSSQTPPIGLLVGGQPAAGKTGLISHIKQLSGHSGYVEINGDDLRNWHPNYMRLLKKDDKVAADETQIAVNMWVENLLKATIASSKNLIIEGTMRKPQVPIETAQLLKDNGYRVGVYAMAIPFWQSVLRIYERYETQKEQMGHGRFSDLGIHKQAYENFVPSLTKLLHSRKVDFIKVYGRDSDGLKNVFDSGPDHIGMTQVEIGRIVQVIHKERSRAMTATDLAEYLAVWDDVLAKMNRRYASTEEIRRATDVRDSLVSGDLPDNSWVS